MATVLDVIDNLEALDIHRESKIAVGKTTEAMIALNKEQLEAGYGADGKRIGRYRSQVYAQMKNAMNPLPGLGNVDLILTGAFSDSFQVDVNGDEIERIATDSKTDVLIDKYGDDVFGLTDNNQEFYNEEVFYPVMADQVTDQTGLEFN